MRDRLICLCAAALPALFIYGFRVFLAAAAALCGAVAVEAAWNLMRGKPQTLGDLSAVVAAMTLVCLLPPGLSLGTVVLCSMLSVAVFKIPFGDGVRSPLNPAAAGAALAAMLGSVTKKVWPTGIPALDTDIYIALRGRFFEYFGPRITLPLFAAGESPVGTPLASRLDPLVLLNAGGDPELTLGDFLFFGFNGTTGGVAVLILLAAAAYLYYRRAIRIEAPASFLAAMLVISFIFPYAQIPRLMSPVYSLFCGGTVLAAVFLAGNQYTSPNLRGGRILYGAGCGLLTFLLRRLGMLPSEAAFAILIMNALSNPIDLLAWEIRRRGVSFTGLMDHLTERLGRKKRDENEVTI